MAASTPKLPAVVPAASAPDPTANLPTMGGVAQGQARANGLTPFMNAIGGGRPMPNPEYGVPDLQGPAAPSLADQVDPGVAGAIKNFFWNNTGSPEAKAYADASTAAGVLRSPAYAAHVATHPDVGVAAQQDPVGTALKIGPMLEAAVAQQKGQTAPTLLPNGKTDTNAAMTDAVHQAVGEGTRDQIHAALEPHQYDFPEFYASVKGLSRAAMERMYSMHQVLSPTQQAQATYFAGLQNAAVAEAQANKTSKTPTNAAQQQLQAALRGITFGLPPQ